MAFTMSVADLIEADTSGLLGKHSTWARVPLAAIASILNGAPFDSSLFSTEEGMPLVRIRDVTTGDTDTYYTGPYEDSYLVKRGDLLVGMDGDFNSGFWGARTALLNQRVCRISPDEQLYDKRLLAFVLPGYLAAINANTPSVTVKHLSSRTIGEIALPLPPRAEQTRIVAKLDELLSDLDAGVAELKAAQKKLTQYRQSLLKAAVEGALTAEWRTANRLKIPLTSNEPSPLAPLPRGERGIRGEGPREGPWLTSRAKALRREQTPTEHALWQHLRAKRFAGYKFRRQQPIGRYIVDFVCLARKLVVELDGSQHMERAAHDEQRDAWLRSQGFRVLRFWNNEWTGQREAVLERILRVLEEEPPRPSPLTPLQDPLPLFPSPPGGEGLGERGEELLRRILVERRLRWEAKQLARFEEQGKAPPPGWQQKYPEPVQPDTTGLPALPEGWVWASVDQLSVVVRGASPRPAGDPRFFGGDIPWITVGSLTADDSMYLNSVTQFVTQAGKDASRFVEPGTLLLTNSGATLGVPKITNIGGCINDGSVALLDVEGQIQIYLYWYLRTQTTLLRATNQGAAQPNLNTDIVKRICVPVCPVAEMAVIVSVLTDRIDALEEQRRSIEVALKQTTAQRQNILRAAFSGELVPQDPNDEPASVLLERIRAERAARAGDKKPRGRSARTAG